jgi:S1-C subfamily serine protease
VAVGTVALMGGLGTSSPDRIVERVGVRDQLADAFGAIHAEEPAGLSEVVAAVSPSVVRIDVADGQGGSGVVLRDDGHILTNAHVVGSADEVTIVRTDGRVVHGTVVGVDEVTDLAVVAPDDADGVTWTPVVRGSVGDLRIGDPTVALAAPADGGGPAISVGMVAAVSRLLRTASGDILHGLIQTDAAVPASGGALCDGAGRVVGLTTAAAGDGGAGYATAMDDAWPTAQALIEDGEVHHPWLGIQGTDLEVTASSLLGLTDPAGGVVLEQVDEAGPAAAAGLVPDDVVLALDGLRVATMNDLVVAVRDRHPGDVVTLTVLHDGTTRDVAVTLGERR